MKAKPDINAFLEGGAGDAADKSPQKRRSIKHRLTNLHRRPIEKVHREQKIFRLPLDLINDLKREAYERSIQTGSRVTETELVEQALRDFFKKIVI
jgi:plasmid segregation centromere-binding protein ParG